MLRAWDRGRNEMKVARRVAIGDTLGQRVAENMVQPLTDFLRRVQGAAPLYLAHHIHQFGTRYFCHRSMPQVREQVVLQIEFGLVLRGLCPAGLAYSNHSFAMNAKLFSFSSYACRF